MTLETVIKLSQEPAVPGAREGIREYQRRITDWPLELDEDGYAGAGGGSRRVVKLEEGGSQVKTEALHRWLNSLPGSGVEGVDFLIGGKTGFPSGMTVDVAWNWSLGSLTYNQAIAALVVAEQLYRCWALRNNHPYHETPDG